MTVNSGVASSTAGSGASGQAAMKPRWCSCRSLRRISLAKTAGVVFVAGVLLVFCCSLQLYQVPLSSALSVEKKVASPPGVKATRTSPSVWPVTEASKKPLGINISQAVEGKVADGPGRVIGKGRSPKQVDEDAQSQHLDKKDDNIESLNYTRKSIAMPEAFVPPLPSLPGPNSLKLLQDILLAANREQRIYNQAKFSPLGPDSLVLIVQVHKRERYLKQLLDSLKVAKGIENVLLVISHDYYYDDMNDLIRSIDFCPVRTVSWLRVRDLGTLSTRSNSIHP